MVVATDHHTEMSVDVEGSGSDGGDDGDGGHEVDHGEEFQFGWDEDRVDLDFKSGHTKQIKF